MSDPYRTPDPSSSPQDVPTSRAQSPYEGYADHPGYGQQPPTPPAYGQQPPAPGYGQQPPAPGYGQQPGYPQYAPEMPGRTMGIVGFILAFVVPPGGIIVSAMALSESKKAGVPNTLATWGLWLSIAFTAFGLLMFLGWLGLVFSTLATVSSVSSSIPVT